MNTGRVVRRVDLRAARCPASTSTRRRATRRRSARTPCASRDASVRRAPSRDVRIYTPRLITAAKHAPKDGDRDAEILDAEDVGGSKMATGCPHSQTTRGVGRHQLPKRAGPRQSSDRK